MATSPAAGTKKKTTKTKKASRPSAATVAEDEIVQKVWGPKLYVILTANDTHEDPQKRVRPSMAKLVEAFNKEHKTNVSATTVAKWCKVLGWSYTRVPVWVGVPEPTTIAAPPIDLDPDTAPDNPNFGSDLGPDATRGFNPTKPVVVGA